MLEVCIVLDYANSDTKSILLVYSFINSLYYIGMFTDADKAIINEIHALDETKRYAKTNLVKLRAIKERITRTKDKECFCQSVRRRVWYTDFRTWYESRS